SPSGRAVQIVYNDDGQATSTTDPRGGVTKRTYDGSGRLATLVSGAAAIAGFPAENQTTSYTYDANGRVISVSDPLGKVWTRTYDQFGRLTATTDPLGNSTVFAYDKMNRLISQTDGANLPSQSRQTVYAYDASG